MSKKKNTKGNGIPIEEIPMPDAKEKIDPYMVAKEPVVVPQTAQIAFADNPILKRKDVYSVKMGEKTDCKTRELMSIETLANLTEKARSFIPFLYSYRSITKALDSYELDHSCKLITQAHEKGGAFKAGVDGVFKNLFEERFNKIMDFIEFLEDVPKEIQCVLAQIGKNQPSDVFYMKLTELLDVLYNLDNLKVVKIGIQDDMRYYKSNPKIGTDKQAFFIRAQQILSVPNKAISDLKGCLERDAESKKDKSVYVPLFTGYFEYLMKAYNNGYNGNVLMPGDRSAIIIALVVICVVHCERKQNSLPTLIELPVFQQVIQVLMDNPIVPLYGENSLAPGFVLDQVDGFPRERLATTPEKIKEKSAKYLIANMMPAMREKYQKALSAAASLIDKSGRVKRNQLMIMFRAVADMSWAIKAQWSFKMMTVAEAEQGTTNYDKKVRLNYTKRDLNALVELIGYLKTLSCTAMMSEEAVVKESVITINREIQDFVQNVIERPLCRANAAKAKDDCVATLEAVRNVFGKWGRCDPSAKKLPKKTKALKIHEIKESKAMVSVNQIDILRVEAYHMIKPDSKFLKKVSTFRYSHFRPKHVGLTQNFLDKSYNWYLLVNYLSAIREATNLSGLWFREIYLDMDKKFQFPVRSSLPFILAEHLLTVTDRPELHDSMMFPFEIYNDAAYTALNTFKSQYLYKEIEAEVSLCIDMIAFTFSETFYKCCRKSAASMELPGQCFKRVDPAVMRYDIVIQQNKLQLLGSGVDFNHVATTKLNEKIRKELESYLELATDLRPLPYIAHLVRVVKTTHELLREHNLMLDDFDTLWQKAKGFTNPVSLESNLVNLILQALDFPHWVYNCDSRRFIVTKPITLAPTTNEDWAAEYVAIHQQELEFIGPEHFNAVISLLSKGELAYFINGVTNRAELELLKVIDSYTSIAPSLRVNAPQSKDELVGYYNFNSDAYSELVLPNLGSLLNSMRILGNCLMLMNYIDGMLPDSKNDTTLISPFMAMMRKHLQDNHELFFQTAGLDLENASNHRSFAALWSILEYIYCLPKEIKINEQQSVKPLATFGDGVVIAAHTIITLCDQESFYDYDSLLKRTLALHNAEGGKISGIRDLTFFLANAQFCASAVSDARMIARPYKLKVTQE